MRDASEKVSSLARRIQLQLGWVIATVILCVTWLSYQQAETSMRAEVLDNLRSTTQTRASFESIAFIQAQQNTVSLRDEYLRRLNATEQQDMREQFDAWFVRYPDGLIRVRPERDDFRHLPSIYIRAPVVLTSELRRQVVVAFELLREWGPALTSRYYSAYIDLPGQSLIMYSPSVNWGKEADVTTNNFDYPPVQNSAPEKNPLRKTLWTEVYFDDKAKIWMLSTITPIDRGRWVGTASQDIAVDDLIRRTTNEFAPGTYNLIIDRNGLLVAHPGLMDNIQKSAGNLDIRKLGDPFLQNVFEQAARASPDSAVQLSEDQKNYLGIARIQGPDWYFVTVYPKSLLESRSVATVRVILIGGVIGLLLELILLAWILRKQVAGPLRKLSEASQAVAQGDMTVALNVSGRDELGQLERSFNTMLDTLRQRDEALQLRAAELEREVAQRKSVQDSLVQSEIFKDTLLHTIPDIVFVKDSQGRFIAANRAFETKYGQRIADIQGKTDFDFLDESQARYFEQRDSEALAAGKPVVSEAWQTDHSTGVEALYETIKTPLISAGGELMGLMGVGRDITARKRAEDALHTLNMELEARVGQRTGELEKINQQLMRTLEVLQTTQDELVQGEKLASLGRMVAGLAHELNTPIGNAMTIGTTMADQVKSLTAAVEGNSLKRSALLEFCATAGEAAQVLERALRQANELVTNFKQVSADQLSERRREFDLAVTVGEIISTLRPGLRGTDISIAMDIPVGIAMDSFPGLLAQVISNLVNNAKMHAFGDAMAGEIVVAASDCGSLVELAVTDNGAGIPAEIRGQIFDPFFTTRLGRGGTGLGLSIVHAVVTQGLGGSIRLDSTRESGARFVILIPRKSV